MVEVKLQFLIGAIDTELLEMVLFEHLEAEDVQHGDLKSWASQRYCSDHNISVSFAEGSMPAL